MAYVFATLGFYFKQKLYWTFSIPGEPLFSKAIALLQPHFFGREKSLLYGPIYKIWDGMNAVIVIADRDLAREFYKDHLQHPRTRSFTLLGPICSSLLGHAIGTAYGQNWVRHALPFKKDFLGNGIETYKSQIFLECTRFVEEFTKIPSNPITFHPDKTLNRFTLTILAKMLYGYLLTSSRMERLCTIASKHEKLMQKLGSVYSRLPGFKFLPTETNKLLKEFEKEWTDFNMEMINELTKRNIAKFSEQNNHQPIDLSQNDHKPIDLHFCAPMISHFLDVSLTQKELLHNLDEILLFNIDVMYSAISGALVNLAKHPTFQDLICKEIQQLDPLNENNVADLRLLKYFILESARVSPSLALSFPEHSAQTRVLNGFTIPKGTAVLMDVFSINHDAKYWTNPDEFNPNRFENNESQTNNFHRFGLGPRRCLGRKYADFILTTVLARFVQHFTVTLHPENLTTQIKADGLPFFTPWLNFPSLFLCKRSPNDNFDQEKIYSKTKGKEENSSLTIHEPASLDHVFKIGIKNLKNNAPVLCGM